MSALDGGGPRAGLKMVLI